MKNNNNKNNNQKVSGVNSSKKKRRPRNATITQRLVLGGIPRQPSATKQYRALLDRYHGSLYRYLRSLFYPEEAVSGSFAAKQPSFTSIPTTTIAFKEQAFFKTSSLGMFNLIWVPNFFSNRSGLEKHLESTEQQITQYGHLYFADASNNITIGPFKFHSSYAPLIALAKYRLVSAKLVVEYNGQQIQKGGTLQSCAIYNDLPVIIQRAPVGTEDPSIASTVINAELAQYCDVELIRNGLWNNFKNLSDMKNNKIEMLALPTDPTDQTFYPMCHYYAAEPTDIVEGETTVFNMRAARSSDGGHLSYVVKGTGLLSSEGMPLSMIATAYYNFEIIADQSTAPFLRSKGRTAEDYWLASIMDRFKGPIADAVKIANMQGQSVDVEMLAKNLLGEYGIQNLIQNPILGKPIFKGFKNLVKQIAGSNTALNFGSMFSENLLGD